MDQAPNPDVLRTDAGALAAWLQHSAETGDLATLDRVVPALFEELRVVAHRHLMREVEPVTLQTTELVHEAYLRLMGAKEVTRKGRAYFFAAAGRAMRQVLVDAARRRHAAKRGGGARRLSLDDAEGAVEAFSHEIVELDEALRKLEALHPRPARVVDCRFFGGMSVEDTAMALNVSPRTVKADWAMARAWLYDALQGAIG